MKRAGRQPKQVNIHQAKTGLSKLVERVEGGEEIVIARAGTPVAKLVALKQSSWRRRSSRQRPEAGSEEKA